MCFKQCRTYKEDKKRKELAKKYSKELLACIFKCSFSIGKVVVEEKVLQIQSDDCIR